MKYNIIFLLLCSFSISISAQHYCGSHELYQEMMKNDPGFRMKQRLSKQHSSSRSAVQGIITIPVVVHVVYNNAAENVSDEQIYSQIAVLNEDCNSVITGSTQWSDVAANPQMQFCLANRDRYGNATCGITRTYTDSTEFRIQTSVKDESTGGISGWPARDYLNIFVCDIGGGLRGYATFPDALDAVDGIVIDYLSFGRGAQFNYSDPRFNLGRTGTHEVGHWLKLYHIWGDGGCNIDDGIVDTPTHSGPNYGCAINSPACPNQFPGYTGPLINMVQNYMDYSDDACMNLFTQGQVNLMRGNFAPQGSRVSILSSKGCQAPAKNEIYFTIKFDGFPEDISWKLYDSLNNLLAEDDYALAGLPASVSKSYTLDLPDGTYTLKFFDSWGDGFCCDQGNGSYEIKSIYNEVIISGPGTFTNELSIPFTLGKAKYRFIGPGLEWETPGNWNRFSVPGRCYAGDIIIESNCVADSVILNENQSLFIINNVTLTVE